MPKFVNLKNKVHFFSGKDDNDITYIEKVKKKIIWNNKNQKENCIKGKVLYPEC
jgi:hypothetical protein